MTAAGADDARADPGGDFDLEPLNPKGDSPGHA